MRRSTQRILTTHTGSLPRPAKVVEQLLAEKKGVADHAALDAAVREAIADVIEKQKAAGIDIVNDGEQGRTDYTVHVIDRLTGFEGISTPPLGTGEPEFPELAELLKQFASPFQHRPACSGPVGWKDFAAAEADIARSKAAMTKAGVEEAFMTSPSPGQIARYLKNHHYKTVEEYLYALADVMKREYRAIVEAGFILQLDCPDLAMSYALYPEHRHRRLPQDHHGQRRGAEPFDQGPAGRPHAHARVLGLDARAAPRRRAAQGHRRHHPQGASRRRCRSPAPIRATATSGRCGRTSSCRTARSSFPA